MSKARDQDASRDCFDAFDLGGEMNIRHLNTIGAFLLALLLFFAPAAVTVAAGTNPSDEAVAKLKEVVALLEKLDKKAFEGNKDAPAQLDALAKVITKLTSQFEPLQTNARVGEITSAASAMATALTGSSDVAKALIKSDPAAVESLTKLLLTIEKLKLTNTVLVVRVIEAKFGDTYPVNRYVPKRWCDATAYMRGNCDRKAKCELTDSYQNEVCGFNPAPAAELRHRGVYVRYECVRNMESNFVGRYVGTGLVEGASRLSRRIGEYTILRGKGVLMCGAEKEAAK